MDPIPSSQDVPRKEFPLDRALEKYRLGLGTYRADLIAAGVSEEQIATAVSNGDRRIRAEFEERAKQDPFSVVQNALVAAAQTPDEKLIAQAYGNEVNWSRQRIERYKQEPRLLRSSDEMSEWRYEKGAYPRVQVLGSVRAEDGKTINVPPEFEERFLRNLGVLDDGQSLQDLWNMQLLRYDPNDERNFSRQPNGPVQEEDTRRRGDVWIARLPTNIDGVEARVNRSKYGQVVEISIAPEVLPKIQSAPQR